GARGGGGGGGGGGAAPGGGAGPAGAVVADHEHQHVLPPGDPDPDPGGGAVLGRVGEQFGGAEVGDRLDRLGRADRHVHLEIHRNGAARRQGGQRIGEAVVERRRVNAPGQAAQLGERVLGTPVRGVEQFPGRRRVGHVAVLAELLLGHAEVHGQRRQPDL